MAKLWGVLAVAVGLVSVPAAQTIEHIDPAGDFTHVVTVSDRGVKTIYVSGQSADRSIQNVAWGITDMDEAVAAFKAVGAKTLVEPVTVNDVITLAFFEDPNGVSVELLELPQ